MNNKCLPISQSIDSSGLEYPYQFSPNLNYFFYIMPDKSQLLIPGLNYYPVLPMSYVQNTSQPLLMNINPDNNEAPILFNYNYNNIYPPLNSFAFGGPISPQNNQFKYEQSSPAPISKELSFLNKKRNNSTANKKDKDKEKEQKNDISKKNEEEIKHLNDNIKITDKENLENKETKFVSPEENNIKVIKSEEKEEIQKEKKKKENKTEAEKENIIPSSASQNEDKKDKGINISISEKKKGKKKKKNYAELLHDTILEHIGEPKKKVNSTIENEPVEIESKNKKNKNNIKSKNKNKPNHKDKNIPSEKNNIELDEKTMENTEKKDKEKNKKSKIKNQRSQRKKQHKITLKNNKDILADLDKDKIDKNEINPKITKIIFHGENYENTKSTIDFMKYNFDFRIEEQYKTKKLITDYDQQHIDLTRINEKLYENYNTSSQNLKEIEQKWSRQKFRGDNKELKRVISIIKDSFPGRKIDVNEEKCLNILKNKDYNIQEFFDSRHAN